MIINKAGRYSMRNGQIAVVINIKANVKGVFCVVGHNEHLRTAMYWAITGDYSDTYVALKKAHPLDLVEYLGEEEVKEKPQHMERYTIYAPSHLDYCHLQSGERVLAPRILGKGEDIIRIYFTDGLITSQDIHCKFLSKGWGKRYPTKLSLPPSCAASCINVAMTRGDYD